MCTWKSKSRLDYKCNVQSLRTSPEGYCIFHFGGDKSQKAFQEALNKQLHSLGPADERNERFDFTGYVFPCRLTVSPSSAPSDEEIVIPNEFPDAVRLDEALINGDLVLRGANLHHSLSANDCRVLGSAILTDLTVGGDLDFDKAHSERGLFLNRSEIAGRVSLSGGRIKGELGLDEATVHGPARLNDVQVGARTFAGRKALLGRGTFQNTRFLSGIYLQGARFEDGVTFEACQASRLDLGQQRPRIPGLKGIRDSLSKRIGPTHASKRSFWAFARATYSAQRDFEAADAANYWYRVWQLTPRRAFESFERSRMSVYLEFIARLLFLWLPDCMILRWPTAYGARVVRLVLWWASAIFIFAGIYHLLGLGGWHLLLEPSVLGLTKPCHSFGDCLYFSVITFTTLGYGDIRPARGLGSTLAGLEAVLGSIMIALAVMVIGRKFLR